MITSLNIGRLGRFANGAYMIAGAIGVAIKSGQPYAFPKWINHDAVDRFGCKEDSNIGSQLLSELPEINPNWSFKNTGYFWGFQDLYYPTGNWSIDGHMQSERFFKHCLPLIKETFTFKNEPQQNENIAVHWRAGDYQDGENVHHPRQTMAYYHEAWQRIGSDGYILIFSDDTEAAAKMFNMWLQGGKAFIVNTGSYLEDFKLMKKCRSFITANSSFSSFAAILGNHPDKKVIMPSNWFGTAWGSGHKGMAKDIYPENAIII